VESQVTQRITELNIKERVDNLIAQANQDLENNLSNRILSVEQKQTELNTVIEAQIKEIKKLTAQTTETGKLIISVKEEEAKTIGSGIIKTGETSVEIETKAVNEGSRIFTNIISKISDAPVLMTPEEEIVAGESFKVEINNSLTQDVKFNWWIVGSE
jgi:hypothetical protein